MSLFEEVGLDLHGWNGRAAEAEVSEGMAASSVTMGELSNEQLCGRRAEASRAESGAAPVTRGGSRSGRKGQL